MRLAWWQRGISGLFGLAFVSLVVLAIARWRLDGAALTVLAVTGVIALAVALIGVVPTYFTHNGLAIQLLHRRQREQLRKVERRSEKAVTDAVDDLADVLTVEQLEAVAEETPEENLSVNADRRARFEALRAARAREHLEFKMYAERELLFALRDVPGVTITQTEPDGPDILVAKKPRAGRGEPVRRFVIEVRFALGPANHQRLSRLALKHDADVIALVRELPPDRTDWASGLPNLRRRWNNLMDARTMNQVPAERADHSLWVTTSVSRVLDVVARTPVLASVQQHPVYVDLGGRWVSP